jgi:hypothetical protein
MAASCSGGREHILGVALNVATKKIEAESDIFTCKRQDYTAYFDKQRHLAGNFRGVRRRLCWIFKFCLGFFSVSAGVSFQLAYCRAICFFALVEIRLVNTFSENLSLFFLFLFLS